MKLRRPFPLVWLAWLGWFGYWEAKSILDAAPGDSFTEHVRWLFAQDPRWQVAVAILLAWLPYHFFIEPRLMPMSDPKPAPKPQIPPLVEEIVIHAGELIPSAAVLELEGEQKRLEVRERIKARFNLKDKEAARSFVDGLLPFHGIAELGSDLIVRALPLDVAVDKGLDWLIQVVYRGLKAAGAVA